MSLFDHPLARTLGCVPSVSRRARSAFPPAPTGRPAKRRTADRRLQARMLWLICGLVSLFGCFYQRLLPVDRLLLGSPGRPVLCSRQHHRAALRPIHRPLLPGDRHHRRAPVRDGGLHHAVPGRDPFPGALVAGRAPTIGALIAGPDDARRPCSVLFVARGALLYRLGPGSIGPISLTHAPTRRCRWRCRSSLSAVFVSLCAALGSHWSNELRRALEFAREGGAGGDRRQSPLRDQVSYQIRIPLQGIDRRHRDACAGRTFPRRGAPAWPTAAAERRRADGPGQRRARLLQARRRQGRARTPAAASRRRWSARSRRFFALPRPTSGDRAGLHLLARRARADPRRQHADPPDRRQPRGQRDQVPRPPAASTSTSASTARRPADAAGSHHGMRVRIQIADSGVGIDPARLPFLFKPFHQADESIGRRFGGTGLRACRSPTTWRSRMGGRIEATSAVARGKQLFTLVMPHRSSPSCRSGSSRLIRPRPFDSGERLARAEPAPAEDLVPKLRSARRPDGGRRRGRSGQSGGRRRHRSRRCRSGRSRRF